MAKLTQDISRTFENGDNNSVPVAAGKKIYAGALVGINEDGYARPFTATDKPMGFARDQVDNTSGADGDKTCELKAVGKVELSVTGVAMSDIGKSVYATDDDTFSLNDTAGAPIGKVIRAGNSDDAIVAFDFLNETFAMQVVSAPINTNDEGE